MFNQNTQADFQPVGRRKKRSYTCNADSICLRNVLVYGDLEVLDGVDYDLHVESMTISGSLHVGTVDNPFQNSFTLSIHGDKLSPSFENPDWIHGIVGPKALGENKFCMR